MTREERALLLAIGRAVSWMMRALAGQTVEHYVDRAEAIDRAIEDVKRAEWRDPPAVSPL